MVTTTMPTTAPPPLAPAGRLPRRGDHRLLGPGRPDHRQPPRHAGRHGDPGGRCHPRQRERRTGHRRPARTMPLPAGIDLWLMAADEPRRRRQRCARQRQRGRSQPQLPPRLDADRRSPATGSTAAPARPASPRRRRSSRSPTASARRSRCGTTRTCIRISPSSGSDGPLRQRYAELTGLPYVTSAVTGRYVHRRRRHVGAAHACPTRCRSSSSSAPRCRPPRRRCTPQAVLDIVAMAQTHR